MMDWQLIHGFDGWSAALTTLIDRATTALAAKSHDDKAAALCELRDFVRHSPDAIAASLDDIAIKTIAGIVANDWEEAVAEMHARSADLIKLTKHIGLITASANASADSIRLTLIRSVVDDATATIQQMNELKAQLQSSLAGLAQSKASALQKAIAKIEAAIRAAQGMRATLEELGQ